GRTFADRAALRRAESAAGRPGAPCGRLALVQPVAAAARRGGAARRRAAAAGLVGVRESAGDRGRAGGPAALGGAWQSLRRAGLGGADRQAIGIRGNVTAPGTSTQTDTEGAEITTPDPFPRPEKELLTGALKATGGNQLRAAKMLGISRKMMHARVRQFQIPLTHAH